MDTPKPERFCYQFSLIPDEAKKWSRAFRGVFSLYDSRVEIWCSEEEFGRLRIALKRDGFVLSAITRVPYVQPQVIE